MILVAGEEEKLYPQRRTRRGRYRGGPIKSTVDVASILEAKYHVLEFFFDLYYDQILEIFAEQVNEELIFEFSGGSPSRSDQPEEQIAALFREFIEGGNVDRIGIVGTPTKAALRRGGPSFWETGLFKDNARFWLEE